MIQFCSVGIIQTNGKIKNGRFKVNFLSELLTWFILFQYVLPCAALFENCDFDQLVSPNEPITFGIPHVPENGMASCRIVFKAPIEYHVVANCTIEVAELSSVCGREFLALNNVGSRDLSNTRFYCTSGRVTTSSLFQSLTVAAQISKNITINCLIEAVWEEPADCDCGWSFTDKIAGGNEAGLFEFPSVVGLVAVNPPGTYCNGNCENVEGVGQYEIYCGATIISPFYVLSTATCIRNYKPPGNLMVVAGQHATNLAHPTQYTQHIMVESYQLLKTNVYYLALLKLTKPLEWTLAVGPACLPFYYRDSDFLGQYLTMVGWGQTGANESRSAVLLKTQVSAISLSECQQIMPEVYNTEICTYTPPRGGCVLDTGGPAYFQNVRQFLIGIIGYRHECGLIQKAGVNVRVGSFLKWIQQNVGDRLCLKF